MKPLGRTFSASFYPMKKNGYLCRSRLKEENCGAAAEMVAAAEAEEAEGVHHRLLLLLLLEGEAEVEVAEEEEAEGHSLHFRAAHRQMSAQQSYFVSVAEAEGEAEVVVPLTKQQYLL
jgi:hypothetical protein